MQLPWRQRSCPPARSDPCSPGTCSAPRIGRFDAPAFIRPIPYPLELAQPRGSPRPSPCRADAQSPATPATVAQRTVCPSQLLADRFQEWHGEATTSSGRFPRKEKDHQHRYGNHPGLEMLAPDYPSEDGRRTPAKRPRASRRRDSLKKSWAVAQALGLRLQRRIWRRHERVGKSNSCARLQRFLRPPAQVGKTTPR